MTKREFIVWSALAPRGEIAAFELRYWWKPAMAHPPAPLYKCSWTGCRGVALVDEFCAMHATVFGRAK